MLFYALQFCHFYLAVDAIKRAYMSHKPMIKKLKPEDSYAIVHFPINALGMTLRFMANYNSSDAYEDREPRNDSGLKKGELGAQRYEEERKTLREKIEEKMGIRVGKNQCYQLC